MLASSNLHLPKISQGPRSRFHSSPNPSSTSPVSSNLAENVSALKAKYTDYAMWLKAASRQNREPVFTNELLKHSLCQMGIDSAQAEQLVSTCSWYVYQFQKELSGETDSHTEQSTTMETKKPSQPSKVRPRRTRGVKLKKAVLQRECSFESNTTANSISKETFLPPGPPPPTRHKLPVLPAIPSSDPSLSPRSRHVDFDPEQQPEALKAKPSHWRSALTKARILPKLSRTETVSSVNDSSPGATSPVENSASNARKLSEQSGTQPQRTRSILRKQHSSVSSLASTVLSNRKGRGRLLSPSSTIVDEVPLGTRSQRLFGGSECFAAILNELEEQKWD